MSRVRRLANKVAMAAPKAANVVLSKVAGHAEGVRNRKRQERVAKKKIAAKKKAKQKPVSKPLDALEKAKQGKGKLQIFDFAEDDGSKGLKLVRNRKSR